MTLYPSTLALLLSIMILPISSISTRSLLYTRTRWLQNLLLQSNNNDGGGTVAFQQPRILSYAATSSFHHQPSKSATSRLFSSTTDNKKASEVITIKEEDEQQQPLLPFDILRELQNEPNPDIIPKIPHPKHLSPTSLETFKKCPQAFFFLYILKLSPDPPMTDALARGIICHTALEEVFDFCPEDRTIINLENLFRRGWSLVRGDRDNNTKKKDSNNKYDVLFRDEDGESYNIDKEIEWGKGSLQILRSYYELEDPRTITPPNPLVREMWVHAQIPTDVDDENIELKGKIDRIDILPSNSPSERVQLQIIDYKTGKKPWFKYSKAVNERIANEQVWKMKVYALILWKMILQTDESSDKSWDQRKDLYKYCMPWVLQQHLKDAMSETRSNIQWRNALELNSLRLMYLTSHPNDESVNDPNTAATTIGKANCLDFPLGKDPLEVKPLLDGVQIEVQAIAKDIQILVDEQDPLAFKHCDWTYCSCHDLRKRFVTGSVYQDPDVYE